MNRPVNRMQPIHPGEILREDLLIPLGMSVNALAVALNVPATRLHEIVKERRFMTTDTAQRLARYFGTYSISVRIAANFDQAPIPTLISG
jgi:antitoxin HigA-1